MSRFRSLFWIPAGCVLLDLFTKEAVSVSRIVENHGFFLGSFQQLTPEIKTPITALILGIWVLLFSVFRLWLSHRSPRLQIFLHLFLGGIIANGIDKLRLGYVRDFIPLSLSGGASVILNVADLFQWIGIFGVIFFAYQDRKILWPKNSKRLQFWAYEDSQKRFIRIFLGISFVFFMCQFFIFSSLFQFLSVFPASSFLMLQGTLLIFWILLSLIIGFIWSHRIFGPFKVIERRLKGNREQGLRETDSSDCVTELLKQVDQIQKN